jgi:hypothetical protein
MFLFTLYFSPLLTTSNIILSALTLYSLPFPFFYYLTLRVFIISYYTTSFNSSYVLSIYLYLFTFPSLFYLT